jgi:hypothetical protein
MKKVLKVSVWKRSIPKIATALLSLLPSLFSQVQVWLSADGADQVRVGAIPDRRAGGHGGDLLQGAPDGGLGAQRGAGGRDGPAQCGLARPGPRCCAQISYQLMHKIIKRKNSN